MTELQEQLLQGIAEHRTPAAALSAWRRQRTIRLFQGTHTYHEHAPALKEDDLFDLASLTKVVATTPLVMLRLQQHELKLDDRLDRYLPQRRLPEEQQPTIRQLLTHCAGLPPFLPFHQTHRCMRDPAEQDDLILNTPCQYPMQTQAVYSDIGFMILGILLERLDGSRTLDRQFSQDIAQPLGMTETLFNPPETMKTRCVPTEIMPDTTPPVPCQGIVHDENARWRHGVSGHAGLFSTLRDLERYARVFADNDGSFFDPKLVRLFTAPARLVPQSSRCLGWDAHSPMNPVTGQRDRCFAPDLLSPQTFGHTGFTGTSLWIDPRNQCSVIILTNAVHPRRECKDRYFPWRNELHALACRELMEA